MTLAINDTAPDFEAQTTEGKIRFHDWIGNAWAVLFSHPKDFTPTTELGYMAKISLSSTSVASRLSVCRSIHSTAIPAGRATSRRRKASRLITR